MVVFKGNNNLNLNNSQKPGIWENMGVQKVGKKQY